MTEQEFNALRPSAFAIAYWMLGRASEAEDVVQEGFLRMHRARADGELIESPRAYLSTVVSQQREQLATRFFAAAEEGDLKGLQELLAHDVVLHGDGGGKAPAIARVLHGRSNVIRTLTRGLPGGNTALVIAASRAIALAILRALR